MVWFYQRDFEPIGPVTEGQMFELIAAKKLNELTLVWREGMPEWVALMNTPLGDSLELKLTPPPIPPEPGETGKVNRIGAAEPVAPVPSSALVVEPAEPILTADGPRKLSSASGITTVAFVIALIGVFMVQVAPLPVTQDLLPLTFFTVWLVLFICWDIAHSVFWLGVPRMYWPSLTSAGTVLLLIPLLNFIFLIACVTSPANLAYESGSSTMRLKAKALKRIHGWFLLLTLANMIFVLLTMGHFVMAAEETNNANPLFASSISLWGATAMSFMIMRQYRGVRNILTEGAGETISSSRVYSGASHRREREPVRAPKTEAARDFESRSESVEELSRRIQQDVQSHRRREREEQRHRRDGAGRDSQGYIKRY